MLILIAESKTMNRTSEVSHDEYLSHRPLFEDIAENIMYGLREYSQTRLSESISISAALARYAAECIYDFPNKSTGSRAIEAYTGVVFKSLSPTTLSAEASEMCARNVRIVSSLYGWLRPHDIIKPYRFDFGTRLAPDGQPFNRFWKTELTDALISYLHSNNTDEVVDLLPRDAAACFDWKRIKQHAKVYVCDFKTVREDGSIITPNAGYLKKMRGELLRNMLTYGINSADGLKSIRTEHISAEDKHDKEGHLLFSVID